MNLVLFVIFSHLRLTKNCHIQTVHFYFFSGRLFFRGDSLMLILSLSMSPSSLLGIFSSSFLKSYLALYLYPPQTNFNSPLQNHFCIHSSVQVLVEPRKFHFLGFHTLPPLFADSSIISFHLNQIFHCILIFFPQVSLVFLSLNIL